MVIPVFDTVVDGFAGIRTNCKGLHLPADGMWLSRYTILVLNGKWVYPLDDRWMDYTGVLYIYARQKLSGVRSVRLSLVDERAQVRQNVSHVIALIGVWRKCR